MLPLTNVILLLSEVSGAFKTLNESRERNETISISLEIIHTHEILLSYLWHTQDKSLWEFVRELLS